MSRLETWAWAWWYNNKKAYAQLDDMKIEQKFVDELEELAPSVWDAHVILHLIGCMRKGKEAEDDWDLTSE